MAAGSAAYWPLQGPASLRPRHPQRGAIHPTSWAQAQFPPGITHVLAAPTDRRVPAYYALILRSLTVLEGLALTADPEYKLIAAAYPYMARRLLTDPAPELR